jgi:integrase
MAAIHPEELPELLAAIDAYDGELQTRLGLQLMALTFLRTSELLGGEWPEVNIDKAIWTVPGARMKMKTEHLVPLSRQALEFLAQLRAQQAAGAAAGSVAGGLGSLGTPFNPSGLRQE